MSLPKLLIFFALLLFAAIGLAALFKGEGEKRGEVFSVGIGDAVEVAFEDEVRSLNASSGEESENITEVLQADESHKEAKRQRDAELPYADRIEEFFRKVEPRFPIVETITYKSKVPWLSGRPAWVSDYASYYKTSRHFIARSLNGKNNYFKQDVALGDRFNVFRKEKNVEFYLLVDISRAKMWFYFYDKDELRRTLVKVYDIGLGRIDSSHPSGLLTPLGKYSLGEKVAIYKPKQMGWFNGDRVEMMRVFGTRWIPFDCEEEGCSAPAKGFGIHGAPWVENEKGELVEDSSCIGKYESDGCVKLKSDDMEELFSIIITKPAHILLVKDFFDADLPGGVKE